MEVPLYSDYRIKWVKNLPRFVWAKDRYDTGINVEVPEILEAKNIIAAIVTLKEVAVKAPIIIQDFQYIDKDGAYHDDNTKGFTLETNRR
jgi:hypothetical protein